MLRRLRLVRRASRLRVLHRRDARRVGNRGCSFRLDGHLGDDGRTLLEGDDRSADLTLRRAFFGRIRYDAEERDREQHVKEQRREITARKSLTIAPVLRIAL
jgi:hypothetical protein